MTRIRIKFEPRDLWVGAFIKTEWRGHNSLFDLYTVTVYVCLVPMLPLILGPFKWQTSRAAKHRRVG
jgi:hypothetical protein